MSCFSVGSIISSLNNLLTSDQVTHTKEREYMETIKADFNQTNHYLTSRMGNLSYHSFEGAVQDARWITSICTKASSIFHSFVGNVEVDDTDYLKLETQSLYKTLEARSDYVTERQRDKLLSMLRSADVSSDPKGYLDAATLVFTYASKTPSWKQEKVTEIENVYRAIETYAEVTGVPMNKIQQISSLADEIISSDDTAISISVGGTVFKVNRMKILFSSELVKKMILGSFREKGSSSISLNGVDKTSFKYYLQYVNTRDPQVLDDLDLEDLLELNACCSHLIADLNTRQTIISKINEKVSDMTIGYTRDHMVELAFHNTSSSEAVKALLDDVVVQQETGVVDLRNIEAITNEDFENILRHFSNTKTLYVNYNSSITRSGWLMLSNGASVTDLHLDFKGKSTVAGQSFQALKEVETIRRQASSSFHVYIENAGKLEVDSVREIVSCIPESIVSLDLAASFISDDALSEVLEGLCNLEVLNLDYCKKIDGSEFLHAIRDYCPSIKELSLNQTARIKEPFLVNLLDNAQYLTTLNVGWHHYLTDAFVNKLSEKCRKLQVVDFTNLKNISDDAVKGLVKQCSELAKVKLDFCKSLTNQSLFELNKHATNLDHLSIRQMFQRRTPMSIEAVNALMESKSTPFEFVINSSCSDITSVVSIASKYPMVTVRAV